MFTKSSRKRLCLLLSIFMVIGICLSGLSTLVRVTLCYPDYMAPFFETKKISTYCDNAYNEQIALLAENSGIPVRVFETADSVNGYGENAIHRFYSGNDATMFTPDRIDAYETLIMEYLDGNGENYNRAQVHNTAVRAAEIYSDSYGMKNTDVFKDFIDTVIADYNRISSIGLALALVCALLVLIMHGEKKKTAKYYISVFSSTGISFIFIGIVSLIFGFGKSVTITPVVYQNALFRSITVMLLILIVTGFVVTALSTALMLRYYKLTKKTKND